METEISLERINEVAARAHAGPFTAADINCGASTENCGTEATCSAQFLDFFSNTYDEVWLTRSTGSHHDGGHRRALQRDGHTDTVHLSQADTVQLQFLVGSGGDAHAVAAELLDLVHGNGR